MTMTMTRTKRPILSAARKAALSAAAVTLFLSTAAIAQQPAGRPAPQPKAATAPQPKAPPAEAAPAATSDAGLRLRVEQLEEQLVDMQVVIGTLESLARGGGGGASSAPSAGRGPTSGADQARVDQLENQVRTLAAQVEQMSQQLRNQGNSASAAPPPRTQPPASGGFATTVTPDRDPIGQIIGSTAAPPPAAVPGQAAQPTPSLPQAQASDASAKQLYETAYGLLLQQDYGAAEAAFDEFLKRFQGDPLAGNAQYWLGETYFVRGQFKPAAAAFLKGYQTYGRSSKAPDSLLKLAMSLDRLGQRDAACSSYGELTIKFPNAPGAVKNRADNERRRLGCA
jgi:tol-pal system protein YbgF